MEDRRLLPTCRLHQPRLIIVVVYEHFASLKRHLRSFLVSRRIVYASDLEPFSLPVACQSIPFMTLRIPLVDIRRQ